VNVCARNANGIAAMHEAAFRKGAIDAIVWLLQHGADINVRTAETDGDTPLHYAVRGRDLEIIKYLLLKGANIDLSSRSGTPLQLAQELKCESVQRVLENYKARKEFLFSVPPPAWVLSVPAIPVNVPTPNPLLRTFNNPPPAPPCY